MKIAVTAAAAFVFLASNALAQYCPQALYGQMNGSYYYYCRMCQICNQSCYVVTDAAHDTGGGCGTCGTNCADQIGLYIKPAKQAQGGKGKAKTEVANAKGKIDNPFVVMPVMGAQPKYVSYNDKFCAPVPSIKAAPSGEVTLNEVTLEIDEGGHQYFFRCIEVVDSSHPVVLRIGQQLSMDAPPPAAPANTRPIKKHAFRKKGADGPSKNFHHQVQVSESGDPDARVFDVISKDDLDPPQ
jgi:hypothetical protein